MRKVTITELRTLETTTTQASQGTKHDFWPIVVKAGQYVNGDKLEIDERVETSSKALKLDGPMLIAMKALAEWFKDRPDVDESTILRWAFCWWAKQMGVKDETVAYQAERFEATWMDS